LLIPKEFDFSIYTWKSIIHIYFYRIFIALSHEKKILKYRGNALFLNDGVKLQFEKQKILSRWHEASIRRAHISSFWSLHTMCVGQAVLTDVHTYTPKYNIISDKLSHCNKCYRRLCYNCTFRSSRISFRHG